MVITGPAANAKDMKCSLTDLDNIVTVLYVYCVSCQRDTSFGMLGTGLDFSGSCFQCLFI